MKRAILHQRELNTAYAAWAPVYDSVFGKILAPGRRASIAAAERVGGKILDVGTGTGISLEVFSPGNKIVGVDISEPMLRKAQGRVAGGRLHHVEGLAVMDAASLAFVDNSFDAVVAQYVITAVPDPDATLNEFLRVTKPGGEIILANHFAAEAGPRVVFERGFAPLARWLGWRPDFPYAHLQLWAERRRNVEILERVPIPPLGHFALVRFRKGVSEH